MTPGTDERERVRRRHSVRESGQPGGRPLVLVLGFGCDSAV